MVKKMKPAGSQKHKLKDTKIQNNVKEDNKTSESSINKLQNEVAGYLDTLNKEKQSQLKTVQVSTLTTPSKKAKSSNKANPKSSKVKLNKTSGVKKKTFKKFSKFHLNKSVSQSDTNSVVSVTTAFDDILLPTQQLVSSFLPWYDVLVNEPTGKVEESFQFMNDMKAYAYKLLELESKLYQGNNKKIQKETNSSNWVKTAASAGTITDRINALSVLSQEAPVHNLSSFETLLNMSKKHIKRDTMQVTRAIKDILLKTLLPDNRRLRHFHQHPLDKIYVALKSKDDETLSWSLGKCQQFLIMWAFEDKLKKLVAEFINVISDLSRDQLLESKKKAIYVAWALLQRKPEGEKEFLTIIVNKLGDPKIRAATFSRYVLHKVAEEHPMMQGVIVKAVRDLLLVPKLLPRAQYHCICFLTAQMLSADRKGLAEALLKIYMNFFKSLVHKNETRDQDCHNKMMAELLTGVSRTLPFAQLNEDVMNQINELYKAAHHPKMNTVLRAFSILFQILETRHKNADRFYNALYKTLHHPELPNSPCRHAMFLHLLFRSLKFDSCGPRRDAFVKRSLQITTLHGSAFIAATLTMISELMRAKPVFAQRILHTPLKQNEDKKLTMFEDDGDGEEHFYDVDENTDVAKKSKESKEVKSSWIHKSKKVVEETTHRDYDPTYLNPQYCGVERSAFWELHVLTRHYHPTVAFYAQTLLTPGGTSKPFSGDPLTDYSLNRFLERFVYRNPKSVKKADAGADVLKYYELHSRMRFVPKSHRYDIPANTTQFLEKGKFHAEEVFFQKYFSQPSVQNRHRKKKKEQKDEHKDLSDEEFDNFINSAEGQTEINKDLKFYDHISKDGSKKREVEFDESDEDMDNDWEQNDLENNKDDDLEEEEVQTSSAGVFITGGNESKKRKGKEMKILKPKKRKMVGSELGEMLADNALSEFDSISGSATIVKDKSSAKQLRWERKQELKDILQKKRKRNLLNKKGKKSKGQFKNARK